MRNNRKGLTQLLLPAMLARWVVGIGLNNVRALLQFNVKMQSYNKS